MSRCMRPSLLFFALGNIVVFQTFLNSPQEKAQKLKSGRNQCAVLWITVQGCFTPTKVISEMKYQKGKIQKEI